MKKVLSLIVVALSALTCSACGSDTTGISQEEYDKIRTGLTYNDVKNIVGGEGIKISESEEDNDDYIEIISVYKFNGENGGYAEFEFSKKSYKDIINHGFDFSDAELTSKSQYDLS